MIHLDENSGNEQTESNLSLFTDAFVSEKCERLLTNLDALRKDSQYLPGSHRDEQLLRIIRQLDDVIAEYESVSGK